MGTTMKFQPGCPCECQSTCIIHQTSFAASVDLSGEFTYDWYHVAWSSGAIEIDAPDKDVISDTLHPQSPYPSILRLDVKGPSASHLRAYVSRSASNGYLVVELEPGTACGELRIYQSDGATETLIFGTYSVPRMVANQWHELRFCYDPLETRVTASVRPYGETDWYTFGGTVAGHTDGALAGFGVGDLPSGVASFDDFNWRRLWYADDGTEPYDPYDYYAEITTCETCSSTWCGWASGHFDDEDNLTCEWEIPVGHTWAVDVANGWLETSETDSVVLHKTEYPWDHVSDGYLYTDAGQFDNEYYHRHRVAIQFQVDTAAKKILLIAAALDEDNYVAVEVEVAQGTQEKTAAIRIIDVTAGSAAAISSTHIIRGILVDETYSLGLDFNDGAVTAIIGTTLNASDIYSAYDPLAPYDITSPGWQREFKAHTAATYYGGQVGVGVSGTGEARFLSFAAGCFMAWEHCILENDRYRGDSSFWITDQWIKVSGTWPTRAGTSPDYTLQATADAFILHGNPVMGGFHDNCRFYTGIDVTDVGDKASLIFGSNAAGTSYFEYELHYVSTGPDVYAGTLRKVVSGSPTTIQTTALKFGDVIACINDGVITATNTDGSISLRGSGQPDAYGPYYGLKFTAGGSQCEAGPIYAYRTGTELQRYPTWPDAAIAAYARCTTCGGNCTDKCIDNELPGEFLTTVDGMVINSQSYLYYFDVLYYAVHFGDDPELFHNTYYSPYISNCYSFAEYELFDGYYPDPPYIDYPPSNIDYHDGYYWHTTPIKICNGTVRVSVKFATTRTGAAIMAGLGPGTAFNDYWGVKSDGLAIYVQFDVQYFNAYWSGKNCWISYFFGGLLDSNPADCLSIDKILPYVGCSGGCSETAGGGYGSPVGPFDCTNATIRVVSL